MYNDFMTTTRYTIRSFYSLLDLPDFTDDQLETPSALVPLPVWTALAETLSPEQRALLTELLPATAGIYAVTVRPLCHVIPLTA